MEVEVEATVIKSKEKLNVVHLCTLHVTCKLHCIHVLVSSMYVLELEHSCTVEYSTVSTAVQPYMCTVTAYILHVHSLQLTVL